MGLPLVVLPSWPQQPEHWPGTFCVILESHPVAFDANGHGRQASLNGEFFDCPPGAFARGTVDGRHVPCLSAPQQRRFRTGYEHRPRTFTTSRNSTRCKTPAKTGSDPGQPPGRHHHLEADAASGRAT